MALLVRIDVDRPYGRDPLPRHILSRLSSDFFFPVVPSFGYLRELKTILRLLNERSAKSYAFFRQCTLPDGETKELIESGGHEAGLHLEDSRCFESFFGERNFLEKHLERPVRAFSKHGSGGAKFGRRHHAPYEPEKYVEWARRAGISVFMGNLEDPTILPELERDFAVYPSAFWLEPHWRDTRVFTVEWLVEHSEARDIVLLIHPENVLSDPALTRDFKFLIENVETKLVA